jgi:hypothetical protein
MLHVINTGRDPNRGCGRWICSEKLSPIHAEDAPSPLLDLSVYDKVGHEPAPWYRGEDQKLRKKNMVCKSTSSSAQCVTLQIKIWWRKVKTFWVGSAKCFWSIVFVQFPEAGKGHCKISHLPEKSATNMIWLLSQFLIGESWWLVQVVCH